MPRHTAEPAAALPQHATEPATRAPAETAWQQWLTAAAGLAPSTVRTYTGHQADFTRWWDTTRPHRHLDHAEPADVEAYLVHLKVRGLRPATRRTALHALRAYYRWLRRHTDPDTGAPDAGAAGDPEPDADPGGTTAPRRNPAAQVRRPRVPKPHTTIYTPAEADAILTAAVHHSTNLEDSAAGGPTRATHGDRAGFDYAVLATLRWTGLRASELCGLTLTDLHLNQRVVHVHGKGSKHRTVPLPPPLVPILTDYLTRHRSALCNPLRPPSTAAAAGLFLNPASPTRTLAPRALLEICRKHGTTAGVTGPHQPMRWRHTYATHTLALGVDLHSLARLLGHASVSTTERYLHLDTTDLSTALARAYPTAE